MIIYAWTQESKPEDGGLELYFLMWWQSDHCGHGLDFLSH